MSSTPSSSSSFSSSLSSCCCCFCWLLLADNIVASCSSSSSGGGGTTGSCPVSQQCGSSGTSSMSVPRWSFTRGCLYSVLIAYLTVSYAARKSRPRLRIADSTRLVSSSL